MCKHLCGYSDMSPFMGAIEPMDTSEAYRWVEDVVSRALCMLSFTTAPVVSHGEPEDWCSMAA